MASAETRPYVRTRALGPWRVPCLATSSLLAALLAGCIDLVPVAPPPEQPTVFHLSLQLTDAIAARRPGAGLVRVTATLSPGIDPTGLFHSVLDDTLWVLDQSVLPVEHGPRGLHRYSADLLVDPDAVLFAPITIRPPEIENADPARVRIRWPVARRLDPDPLLVTPGSDLILNLEIDGVPGDPGPTFQRWSISLFHSGGWFSQGGDTLPPRQIQIAASFLGQPGASHLAIVNLHQGAELVLEPGEYVMRLDLSQEVRWNAQVQE